jgi:hypothetical protein
MNLAGATSPTSASTINQNTQTGIYTVTNGGGTLFTYTINQISLLDNSALAVTNAVGPLLGDSRSLSVSGTVAASGPGSGAFDPTGFGGTISLTGSCTGTTPSTAPLSCTVGSATGGYTTSLSATGTIVTTYP